MGRNVTLLIARVQPVLDTGEKNSLPRGRGAQEWRGRGLWAAVGRVGRVVWAVWCGQRGVGSVPSQPA